MKYNTLCPKQTVNQIKSYQVFIILLAMIISSLTAYGCSPTASAPAAMETMDEAVPEEAPAAEEAGAMMVEAVESEAKNQRYKRRSDHHRHPHRAP